MVNRGKEVEPGSLMLPVPAAAGKPGTSSLCRTSSGVVNHLRMYASRYCGSSMLAAPAVVTTRMANGVREAVKAGVGRKGDDRLPAVLVAVEVGSGRGPGRRYAPTSDRSTPAR